MFRRFFHVNVCVRDMERLNLPCPLRPDGRREPITCKSTSTGSLANVRAMVGQVGAPKSLQGDTKATLLERRGEVPFCRETDARQCEQQDSLAHPSETSGDSCAG